MGILYQKCNNNNNNNNNNKIGGHHACFRGKTETEKCRSPGI